MFGYHENAVKLSLFFFRIDTIFVDAKLLRIYFDILSILSINDRHTYAQRK